MVILLVSICLVLDGPWRQGGRSEGVVHSNGHIIHLAKDYLIVDLSLKGQVSPNMLHYQFAIDPL